MFFGTINDWAPEGSLISWHPSETTYNKATRAKLNPIRVSYHSRNTFGCFAKRQPKSDVHRLCIGAWDSSASDVPVMTE